MIELICLLIVARVLTYKRSGAKYRLRHSFFAYMIAVSAGGWALSSNLMPDAAKYFQGLLLGVLCVSLFAVRGNVAELFRAA